MNNKIFKNMFFSFTAGILAVLFLTYALPLSASQVPKTWTPPETVPGPEDHPQELLDLARDFRAIRGWDQAIPDFAARVQEQKSKLKELRARLDNMDVSGWDIHFKIDYLLLRSEMDAMEYDLYVRRHTTRDPSMYVNYALRKWAEATAEHFPAAEAKKLVPAALGTCRRRQPGQTYVETHSLLHAAGYAAQAGKIGESS